MMDSSTSLLSMERSVVVGRDMRVRHLLFGIEPNAFSYVVFGEKHHPTGKVTMELTLTLTTTLLTGGRTDRSTT